MSAEVLRNYVGGQYLPQPNAELFPVQYPATGEQLYQVEAADTEVLEQALVTAREGFATWSAMTAVERARILQRAAQLLRQRNDELARGEVLDTGKAWQEAVATDVQTGADAIEYFANLATSVMGNTQAVGPDFFYTRHEPLGVVAGIGAWNYPLQIACWKSAVALAAGNAMIFKPSEETPRGAAWLAEIFTEAGVPAGVFNVVQGDGRVGAFLAEHPDIAKVSLTGEVGTGKKVMASAASSLKDVTMELGGKSPLLVFDDADIDEAVTGAMMGNFYTQGEVCTNATRVYVHESIYDTFMSRLLQRTRDNIVVGDPMNPATNMGALIHEEHMDRVLSYIESGLQEGATLLTGGQREHPTGFSGGYFVQPTVFGNCTDGMTIVREEIFGPVMAVLTFRDEADVIRRANDTEYGLAAGVYTQNLRRAHRVIGQLQAGICWVNSYANSPVEMPVGGYKQSGIGRENGVEAFYSYTQTKSVYVGMAPLEGPF